MKKNIQKKRADVKETQDRIAALGWAARDALREATACLGDDGREEDFDSAATSARSAQVLSEMAAELKRLVRP